jgi:hypothetical protein
MSMETGAIGGTQGAGMPSAPTEHERWRAIQTRVDAAFILGGPRAAYPGRTTTFSYLKPDFREREVTTRVFAAARKAKTPLDKAEAAVNRWYVLAEAKTASGEYRYDIGALRYALSKFVTDGPAKQFIKPTSMRDMLQDW